MYITTSADSNSKVGQSRLLFDALFVTYYSLCLLFWSQFVFIDIVITSCSVGGFVLLVLLFAPLL
jgi:hypothetical protein